MKRATLIESFADTGQSDLFRHDLRHEARQLHAFDEYFKRKLFETVFEKAGEEKSRQSCFLKQSVLAGSMALRFLPAKVRIASRSSFVIFFGFQRRFQQFRLKYSQTYGSCRASSKGHVGKGHFLCPVSAKLSMSVARFIGTVLQRLLSTLFVKLLLLGSLSPPFSLESWWCFPLSRGNTAVFQKRRF